MNKKELAEAMLDKLDVRKYEAYSFIDLLIEVLGENLEKGEKILLAKLGTFKVVKRRKKRVINPNNSNAMTIPASKVVRFIPSQNLKAKLRE